ncbi:MAG: DUF637 domain-containing protein, partial [Proteobacteria bacterium]|nr:DUF637 domain-containing protein [Pseudomonadota bacterium]
MTHMQETGFGTSFKALARRWFTYFLSANMLLTQVVHAFESSVQFTFEHEWVREDQTPLTRLFVGNQVLDFGSLQKGQRGHVDLGGKQYTYSLSKLKAGLGCEERQGEGGSVVRLKSQDKGLRLRFLLGQDGSVTLLSTKARDQFDVLSAGDIILGAGVHDIALAHFRARSVINEGRCHIRQALSVRATGDKRALEDNTQAGGESAEGTPGFFLNAPGASLTCAGTVFMLGGADFVNQGYLRASGALDLRMDGGDFIHGDGEDASASLEVKSAMVIDGARHAHLRAGVNGVGADASLTVSSETFLADTGIAAQNPDADNLTLSALTVGAQRTHIGASTRARVRSAQFNHDMEAAGQRTLFIEGHVHAAEVAHLTAGEAVIGETAVVTGPRVEGKGGTLANHGVVEGDELSWTYGTHIANTGQMAFTSRLFSETKTFENYGLIHGTDIEIASDAFLNKGLIGGLVQGEGARQVKIFARVGGLSEGEILAHKVTLAMGRELFPTSRKTAKAQGESAAPQEAQEIQDASPQTPSFLNRGRVVSAKITLKGKGEIVNAGRMEGDKVSVKKGTRLYNMPEGDGQALLRGKEMRFKGADVFLNGGIFEMDCVEGSLGTFENHGEARIAKWDLVTKSLRNAGLVTGTGLLRAKDFVNLASGTMAGALTLDVAQQGDNQGTLEILTLVGQGHFFNTAHARLGRIDISTFVNQGVLVGDTLTLGKNLTRFENAFKPSPDPDDPQEEEPAVVKVERLVSEDAGSQERVFVNKGTVSAEETTLHGHVILNTLSKWASRVFTWAGSLFDIKPESALKVAERGSFTGQVVNAARLKLEAASLTFTHLENAERVTFGAQTDAQVDHLKNTGDVQGARTLGVGTLENTKNISVSSLRVRGLVNNKGTITLQGRENTFDHVGNEGKIIVPRGAHADIYNLISNNSVEGEGALTIGELENWGAMKLTKLVVRRYFFNVHTLDTKPHVVIQDLAVTNESLASYAPAQILTLRNEGHLEVGRAVIKGNVELEVGSTFAVGDSLTWQGALWDQQENALLVGAHTTFDGAVHNQGEIVLDGGANTFTHLTNGGMLRATGTADLNTQTLINTGSVNAVSTGEVRVQDLQNRGSFFVENSRSLSIIRGENHHNLLIDKSHIAFLPHTFSNHNYVFLGTNTGYLWHFNNANGTLHLCEPTNISELLYKPDMGRIRSEDPLTIETPDRATFRMFLALMRGADIEAPLVIDATGMPSLDLNVALALRGAVTLRTQEFTCNAPFTAPSIRVEAQKTTNLSEMTATNGDMYLQNVAVLGKVGASNTLTLDGALADITLQGTNLITQAKNLLIGIPGRILTNYQTLNMDGWLQTTARGLCNFATLRTREKIRLLLSSIFENGRINSAAYHATGAAPDGNIMVYKGILESTHDDIDITAPKTTNNAGEVSAGRALKINAREYIFNACALREFRAIPNPSFSECYHQSYLYHRGNGSFMRAGTQLDLQSGRISNYGGHLFSLGTMDINATALFENQYGVVLSMRGGEITAPNIRNTRLGIERSVACTRPVIAGTSIFYTQDQFTGGTATLGREGLWNHQGFQDFLTSGPGVIGSFGDLTLDASDLILNCMSHIFAAGNLVYEKAKLINENGILYHEGYVGWRQNRIVFPDPQTVHASASGTKGLFFNNIRSLLNTGTLAGGHVIANVGGSFLQFGSGGKTLTPGELPAMIAMTAASLSQMMGGLVNTTMTLPEACELAGAMRQVAGLTGQDAASQIGTALAYARPVGGGARAMLTQVAQSGASTSLVPLDGPAPRAPSFSLSWAHTPSGPVEVNTLMFHPGMSADRFFQAILHKPIRRHLDDIALQVAFQFACLTHLGCAVFDIRELKENAQFLALPHVSYGALMGDFDTFNRGTQMVLVDAPFETSTHIEIITVLVIPQALRKNPRLLRLAGGNGVTYAQRGMRITAGDTIGNTGAFVSPASIALEAPHQEHAGQVETITDGLNTHQERVAGTGTVDAGGVAYLDADTLHTEGAQISGDVATLARVSQQHQDVNLTATSYTHLHNGYRTAQTPMPSIFSSARGPVALYGDGVKHLTGTQFRSPVTNLILGSSVYTLPAFAQYQSQESFTKKGGFCRGNKRITVHTHTMTPHPVHFDGPRATLATTDVAGLLDLHAPTHSGAMTLLSNHTNLASVQSTSHIVVQKQSSSLLVNHTSSSDTTRTTHHGVDTGGLVCEAHDPTFVEEATRMLEEAAPAPLLLDSTPVAGPLSETEAAALALAPAPASSSSSPAPSLPVTSPGARTLALDINEAASSTPVRVPTYTPKGTSQGVNLTISLTDAMAADPAVQDFIRRTGATTRIVHDTVEDIHTSQASLGMAPMLLIGIGCFLLMPAGGGMFTVMGKAAAASMIPQFANGLVIHGDPVGAFKELTNPDNVRATVLAAATAGVLNGFDIAAPFGSTDLLEHATYAVQSAAVRAPLEMLIARRDMAETIRSNAMGIVANSLGAWAASHIGALYHPADGSAPRIDPITHKVLHFGGGAATAAIMGEDWVSGGAGAVAGEIAGEFYRNTFMRNLKPNTAAWNAAAQRGADVARISAIGFATVCGLDPSIASHTAG